MSDNSGSRSSGFDRRAFMAVAAGSALVPITARAATQDAVAPSAQDPALPVDVTLHVNGKDKRLHIDARTTVLDALREHLKLTGTKFGCGIASCGACTVHVDGKATRSCAMPVSLVEGKSITTIEGLSPDGSHPLQKAWIAEQVPQCGYCQSGQIMQAAELLASNKNPTRAQIVEHMDGNVCSCGTYLRIIAAIQRAGREG